MIEIYIVGSEHEDNSHSYLVGFAAGVMDGKASTEQLPFDDQLTAAVRSYFKACKGVQGLDRDTYLIAWAKGYRGWYDGIIGDTDGGI